MSEFDPVAYREMVRSYQKRDDPTGWFDSIYRDADGDHRAVFWADLEPNPFLMRWLTSSPSDPVGRTAVVVGCGVGDDAEALSEAGYEVTAFDISPEAIRLCKNRYPDTRVNYLVADLFDYPGGHLLVSCRSRAVSAPLLCRVSEVSARRLSSNLRITRADRSEQDFRRGR